ncbi:hypothetical protein HLB44_15885 [Aquincola sp. S2]|uniref:Uncharacterized protein n=1 Tax=Pseudaquabacterium terrae TaxID=2732868 RepID=A0ABX2EIJ6_9BURK|nr:hypothetical protein [Aquabacterium terrae]NRF68475.1 hypothetical protein [Aquabacterium terrae]
MAWRNGFRESGPGTDFNAAVNRMHKGTEWMQRAVEGGTGFWARTSQWLTGIVQSVPAKNLSPFEGARLGTMGAELKELHREQAAFGKELKNALEVLGAALRSETEQRPTSTDGPAAAQHELRVRLAIVEAWAAEESPRKSFKLDRAAQRQIRAQLAQAGHQVPESVYTKAFSSKLSLTTLEDWATKSMGKKEKENDPLQLGAGFLDTFRDHIEHARAHARGTSAHLKSDGGYDELRDICHLALQTEGVQFSHERQRGMQGGLMFNLATPLAEVGVNVGPVSRYTKGRRATVRIGTTTIGSDIFLGTEKRSAKMFGVAATAGIEMAQAAKSVLAAGAAAVLRHTRDNSEGSGVSIRVSKTVKDGRDVAERVIDFLSLQSRPQTRTPSGAEFWERFSAAFINEEVAVIAVGTHNQKRRTGGGVGAGARVAVKPTTFGPFLSAGVDWARSLTQRREKGHTTSETSSRDSRTTLSARGTLAGTAVAQLDLQGETALKSVRMPAVLTGASANMDIDLSGSQGQVRLTIENGRVQAKLSLAQRI